MKNTEAIIVTIGDELLIGQVIDTNSSWMAQQLNAAGILVKKRISIGDSETEIVATLTLTNKEADIVLITGGLGPTSDDITKQVLCKYFKGKMITDQLALENVKHLFTNIYKKPVSEVNLRQADVPDVCTVIQNTRGSAPGMIFHSEGTIFISMPGVPYEMQGIMSEAIPILRERFQLPGIFHRNVLTAGIGESALAELIVDFEKKLPSEIKLAYLPAYGMVRLRLSTTGFDLEKTEKKIEQYFQNLLLLVHPFLVTPTDKPMQEVLGQLLLKLNLTVSTAESCTGGTIAGLISSVPGASQYFEGSIVSYSYAIKEKLLGVKHKTLEESGAVSKETVSEMLDGLLSKMNTDVGIAVSGIMGPAGGMPEKPVGTVWIAVGNKTTKEFYKLHQRFERSKNIEVTAINALNLLRLFILNHYQLK
ncbi:MAG: CinA family nicotinamide mononucleotide deamidase-related protein [Bacteroidetes bacterium]|nr:CinA family nicotinamide mononucleotide deamidase-related protein [Bacteroidota bacterium]